MSRLLNSISFRFPESSPSPLLFVSVDSCPLSHFRRQKYSIGLT